MFLLRKTGWFECFEWSFNDFFTVDESVEIKILMSDSFLIWDCASLILILSILTEMLTDILSINRMLPKNLIKITKNQTKVSAKNLLHLQISFASRA